MKFRIAIPTIARAETIKKKTINYLSKTDIDFKDQIVSIGAVDEMKYDKLIFGVGKSGIDFTSEIMKKYDLPTEEKPAQVGVRFEAPQKHFQKLIDVVSGV